MLFSVIIIVINNNCNNNNNNKLKYHHIVPPFVGINKYEIILYLINIMDIYKVQNGGKEPVAK